MADAFKVDETDIQIVTELDDIELDFNILIPFALVLNELITNAFKYAFTGRESGELLVSLREKDEKIQLTVRDNGVGLPQGFSLQEAETLGMNIISSLVEQIEGQLTIGSEPGRGAEFVMTFKNRIDRG